MRKVKYTLKDRLVLIPVELSIAAIPLAISVVILYLLGGILPALAGAAAVLAGTALFPALLPWIPTRDFSTKGFIVGALIALPFAAAGILSTPNAAVWLRVALGLAYLLLMAPITAYLSLNFTGSSTFTSRTGVKKEIFRYIPTMAASGIIGGILGLIVVAMHFLGGAL
jgi:hypothetical protein